MNPTSNPPVSGRLSEHVTATGPGLLRSRSLTFLALALTAALLLVACGQSETTPDPVPAGFDLEDAEVVVPFAYAPGREVSLQLARTGGFADEVTVAIDATGLPTGVTLSTTSLTFGNGETEADLTLNSDDTVSAADLGAEFQLALSATSGDLSDSATLTVAVGAVVMNAGDAGEGSLRHLDTILPDGSAADLIEVTFDADTFAAPTTIQLASGIDIRHGRHFNGPVNADGDPLVTLRGADTGSDVIGVKDSTVGQFSNLIFENGDSTNGGAIHNAGVLTIEDSIVRQSEGVRGGGIYNQVGAELTLRNTQVSDNSADQGGGIYNNGGTVSLFDSVVATNVAASDGGGVYNAAVTISGTLNRGRLFISGTQIDGNGALHGGGISNALDSDLTLVRATITGNQASGSGLSGGGGIDNGGVTTVTFTEISGNKAGFGGGINNPGGSELRIGSSTIAANVVTSNGGGLFSNGEVVITNSTFANNDALRGGGLFVSSNSLSTAVVVFSTFAGNTAGDEGGGIDYSGELTLRGTLVAENAVDSGVGPDLYLRGGGDFISLGYNLIGDATNSGVFGANNLIGEDPLLGALQVNGGDTLTMTLLAGSPAIDHVPPGACLDELGTPLEHDQRGEARPSAGNCDIGAVEVQ